MNRDEFGATKAACGARRVAPKAIDWTVIAQTQVCMWSILHTMHEVLSDAHSTIGSDFGYYNIET